MWIGPRSRVLFLPPIERAPSVKLCEGNMRREVVLAFAVVGLVMLACVPIPTSAPTAEPMLAPTDELTLTPSPTWTPTPTSTNTPEPTSTFTPTPTPTSTFPPPTLTFTPAPTLMGEVGVVHAVFFYSPSCGYCHEVMEEVLPPLQETYGGRLQVAMIDVSTSEGSDLYFAAVDFFEIPPGRRGVPTVVVGYVVLVGAREIPERLPILIEQGLDEGGVGWPAIPGFEPPS